jgi:hypothetical protein
MRATSAGLCRPQARTTQKLEDETHRSRSTTLLKYAPIFLNLKTDNAEIVVAHAAWSEFPTFLNNSKISLKITCQINKTAAQERPRRK